MRNNEIKNVIDDLKNGRKKLKEKIYSMKQKNTYMILSDVKQ